MDEIEVGEHHPQRGNSPDGPAPHVLPPVELHVGQPVGFEHDHQSRHHSHGKRHVEDHLLHAHRPPCPQAAAHQRHHDRRDQCGQVAFPAEDIIAGDETGTGQRTATGGPHHRLQSLRCPPPLLGNRLADRDEGTHHQQHRRQPECQHHPHTIGNVGPELRNQDDQGDGDHGAAGITECFHQGRCHPRSARIARRRRGRRAWILPLRATRCVLFRQPVGCGVRTDDAHSTSPLTAHRWSTRRTRRVFTSAYRDIATATTESAPVPVKRMAYV